MTAVLVQLTPDVIDASWPRIEKMIGAACVRSHGRYEAKHIHNFAKDGLWQLWVAIDDEGVCAAAGSEIVVYPTGLKVFAVRFGTGRNRERWQHFMEDLVAWGKSQGCTIAEGSFRKGWKKVLPHWSHTHDSLERVL